ncbi:CHAT domain-containing protein [Kitasatospora sp. NPDC047058]|uniref:CHAT domain-containing protein n=1 Tax=Kitasatospora sp. NPDC047058 TaxID=3155620 RepID=UPI00340DE160
MTSRLGRHGGLCFVLDKSGAITAISDGAHRMDPVGFQETTPPQGDQVEYISSQGYSWAGALGRTIEPVLEESLTKLGLPFRVLPAAFEIERSHMVNHRRDMLYQELDAPGAGAILKLTFHLEKPFRWQITAAGLEQAGTGYRLPGGIRFWISADQAVGSGAESLWIDLPAGEHVVVLVAQGGGQAWEIAKTALVVQPEDAIAAATAYLVVRDFPVVLPVVSDQDMADAGSLLSDLGITRAVVVSPLADRAALLGLAVEDVVTVDVSQDQWQDNLTQALSIEGDVVLPADFTGDPARALYEHLAGPGRHGDLVVCDSDSPVVRVIAAGFAARTGHDLALIDVDEAPVPSPGWSMEGAEPLEIQVERYRVALAEQVDRLIAPLLPRDPPASAVLFTRGFAYPLLCTPEGMWADRTALGMLPQEHAPALLLRSLAVRGVRAGIFGVTAIVDALGGPHRENELDAVRESADATVARAFALVGPDATAGILRAAVSELPVDLVTLICHGQDDHIELADGQLRSQEVRTWRLASAPVVFNNSCGSWHTTGAAFVAAGARSYVGTLWPVTTGAAAQVSAALLSALTSTAETPVGSAVRRAVNSCEGLPYDDRYAYILVGLPQTPARLAPVTDQRQRCEIAEHGLICAGQAVTALAKAGDIGPATVIRRELAARLESELRAYLSADPLAGLEVHNTVSQHNLDAFLASYETAFQRTMLASGAATAEEAIHAEERAVRAWDDAARVEEFPSDALSRVRMLATHLARLTELLAAVGRFEEGWRVVLQTTAVLKDPSQPMPASPPEQTPESVVEAAVQLTDPADFLNAAGIIAAALGRPAERIYQGALRHTEDRQTEGQIRSNLAALHQAAGRAAEAEAGYATALPLLVATGDERSIGITRSRIASLRFEQGDLAGAEAIAREVVSAGVRDGSGSWWDANAILIQTLYSAGRPTEAISCAHDRYRASWETNDPRLAWEAAGLLLQLSLKAAIAGAGLDHLAQAVRTIHRTLTRFPEAPVPVREGILERLSQNLQPAAMALGTEAPLLPDVMTALRAPGCSAQARRELLHRARSKAECERVAAVASAAQWRRECLVWMSLEDGRTRSMITDCPPPELSTPAYIRFPTLDSGAVWSDALIEGVSCWAWAQGEVAYRYDGTPAQIVLDKAGRVTRLQGEHYRYREVWGSRQFDYHVTLVLPERALLLGASLRSHTAGPSPRIGVGTHRGSTIVVVDPDPAAVEPSGPSPTPGFGNRWQGTLTLDFQLVVPALREMVQLLVLGEDDGLLPIDIYTDFLEHLR